MRQINDASTSAQRVAADKALIAYDQKHLGTMTKDNEQYRELVDRINSTKADVRSTQWNDLVRSYNEDQVSNEEMVAFAQRALKEAQSQPDQQDWADRITEFNQRIDDDKLQQLQQDYQYGRVDGSVVVNFVDQRLAGMDKDSPRYADLTRWREDFVKSWKADEAAALYSKKYDAYQEGTLSDDQWLTYLHQRVKDAEPGSEEQRAAKHDLVMETFRITENKLIYDVQVNGADPHELIRFYQTSLLTMDHDSARAQDIQTKIQNLELNGVNGIDLGSSTANTSDPSAYGHYVGGGSSNPAINPYPGGGGGGGGGLSGSYQPGSGAVAGSASEAFVQQAMSLLGTRYVLGAESANATDCSGLVYQAFVNAGLGSLINGQRKLAQGYTNYFSGQGQFTTDRSQVQRGDLVVYGDGNRVTHIGIYLGNGKVISALTTSGVTVTNVGGLNVQIKGYLLVDWSKAPSNFKVRPSHTPTKPENPARVPNAADDTPEAPNAHNKGPKVAQVDPASETPQVPVIKHDQVTLPGDPTPPRDRGYDVATVTGATKGSTANIPGALLQIAQRVVSQVGGNPNNEEAVRAVATWIRAESGSAVANNNPFNLTTASAFDLPGEIGRTEQGFAIFRTWQDGADAAANEIAKHYPTIANGIITGNAQTTLSSVQKSNWSTNSTNTNLLTSYNQSGPSTPIIGTGTKVFDTPQSIQGLAAQHPEVVDLFNVDPSDPTNEAWFNQNLHNLELAYQNQDPNRSSGSWQFVKPDGTTEWLPFSPDMYYSALDAKATYQDMPGSVFGGNGYDTRDTLTHLRTDVTIDQWQAQIASIKKAQQAALREGDISQYVSLQNRALDITRAVLQLPPGTPIDTAYYPGSSVFGGFTADQLSKFQTTVDALLPATDDNPKGDPITGLFDPEAGAPTPSGAAFTVGPDGRIHADPLAVYFTQDAAGDITVTTWKQNANDFVLVPNDVTGQQVPAYMNDKVSLNIGADVPVWFGVGTADTTVAKQDPAGYRVPAQVAPPAPPPPDYNYNPVNANPFNSNPYAQAFRETSGAPPNIAPTTGFNLGAGLAGWQGTSQQPQPPAAPPPDPHNVTVTYLGVSVPAYVVRWRDPDSGEWFQAWTLNNPASGKATWVFQHANGLDSAPVPIVNSDWQGKVRVGADGKLQVQTGAPTYTNPNGEWQNYSSQIPASDLFHWFGTGPGDLLKNGIGAPGQNLPIRVQDGTTLNADFHGVQWWNPTLINQQFQDNLADKQAIAAAKRNLPTIQAQIAAHGKPFNPYSSQAPSGAVSSQLPTNNFANQHDVVAGLAAAVALPIQSRLSGSTVASQARYLANDAIERRQAIEANRYVPPPPPPPPPPKPATVVVPHQAVPVAPPPPRTTISPRPAPPPRSYSPPATSNYPPPRPNPPVSSTKIANIPYRG